MPEPKLPADFKNALLNLIEPAIDFGSDDVELKAEPPEARRQRMRGQLEGQLDLLAARCREGIALFQERDPEKLVDEVFARINAVLEEGKVEALGQGVDDELFYHLQAVAYETYEKNDFAAAEPMYTFLVTLRPAEVTSYIVLLTMLWKQQGAGLAADAYETLEPALGTPGFLYFGADCLVHAGRKDKAVAFLEKARAAIEEAEAPSDEEVAMKADVESFLTELRQS